MKPEHACYDCGKKYIKETDLHISTYSKGKCDICKKEKSITHIRSFNYLK